MRTSRCGFFGLGLGAFVIAGGLDAWLTKEVGAGIMAVAGMFSGGGGPRT